MNFQFAAQGSSFKGAMAYYTHDKREPDMERNPTTSDRVAWSETRNMLTDRTDTATRIMISTAERASELKREAGIKATGRQGTKPVAAFSLAWHPDEAKGLGRDEMTRAADQALKVMGLDRCQSVIIAHRDTKHPHVHVVVNRVSPEDGRMAKIDPNRVRALDRWAHDYEKDRGQVYSQQRAEKYERIDDRRRRHPDREDRARHVKDRHEERQRGPERPQSAAQGLRERSAALKVQERKDWKDLGRSYAQAKSEVYDRWRDPIKDEYSRQKAEAKHTWRGYFAEQRQMENQRKDMEGSFAGRLSLSMAAAHENIRTSDPETRSSFVRLTMGYLLSKDQRDEMLKRSEPSDREALAKAIKQIGADRISHLKEDRSAELDKVRTKYDQDRRDLSDRQTKDRAEIRSAWKDIYREKGREWAPRDQADRERVEPDRTSKFDWLKERNQGRDTRSKFERSQEGYEQAKQKDQERENPAPKSKFDWLDERDQEPETRSKFERSQDGFERALQKDRSDRDQDRDR